MSKEENISNKIIRNTKFNILGYSWVVLVYLFLAPYIIGRIGIERFGIWAIISVITGYFGLLDLGFGTPFVKYIAEFYARREYVRINQAVNIGFIFYTFFAIVIIALLGFFMHPIIRLFKIPASLAGETQALFLIGMIIFAASSILKPFEAIQGGMQRMDITNKIAIAVSFFNIFGTVLFLEKGYGLLGLIINSAIVAGITNIINIIVAFKILPELKITLFAFDKKTFRMLFGFGIKRWVTSIEDIVLFQTDKLLISHFLSLSLVGFYQLGFTVINRAWHLTMLAIPAIVPAASELDAMRRRKEIIRLYLKGTKYMFGLSIPVFTFLFASAHLIMFIWMGQGYHVSALVIQLMAASIIVMNFPAVGSAIAVGMGRPEFQMEAAAGQAILNIVLSIILIIKIGFIGVLIATLISVILSTAYFMRRLHNYLNLSMGNFVNKTMVVYLLPIFVVGLLIYLFNQRFDYLIFGRLGGLALLTLEAVLFFFCYFILLRKITFLDKEDMGYLMALRSSIGL